MTSDRDFWGEKLTTGHDSRSWKSGILSKILDLEQNIPGFEFKYVYYITVIALTRKHFMSFQDPMISSSMMARTSAVGKF